MEAYEHVVKVWLETKGFVVSSGVKFPVKVLTRKKSRQEYQVHGYEMDLVAARRDKLVLVNVKSYFGSHGLSLKRLQEEKLFSDPVIFKGVIREACKRYGYSVEDIELWVASGRVTPKKRIAIEAYLEMFSKRQKIRTAFIGVEAIADGLVAAIEHKMYINDPVIAVLRALDAAGKIQKE